MRRALARFEVRLFLGACIVVSLLPLPEVRELDGRFLLVFGSSSRCGRRSCSRRGRRRARLALADATRYC